MLIMATKADIINFSNKKNQFTRSELIKYFKEIDQSVSPNAISIKLDRLVKNQELVRESRGVYRLISSKKVFFAYNSEDIKQLNSKLRGKFPFINFCVWSSKNIVPYMHHIPSLNLIYIDVEREVTDSVFSFLSETTSLRIFQCPDQEEYEKYISGSEAIIIRTLITEAPLQVLEGYNTPTIEKIIVDIIGDVEFSFLQGSEINHVYTTIFERHSVNKNKLLRYATRRGRKEEVEQLLNINKL